MASLLCSISPTISRLRQRGLRGPTPPFLRTSFSPLSTQFSCSPKGQILKAVGQDEDLVVLGIETSCDDTAAAVVRSNGQILSQVVSSQVRYSDLLAQFGGVAPKMAEEAHSRVIDQVVQEALDKAKITEKELSAVAVTIGPGLSLCLRVGVRKARKLAGTYALPIVGVHHMEAHALVARLVERELQFPFMALLISGGHNLLILARDLGHYIQLGTTIDDAIGEAYDKTAKWLGLDMRKSGGPAVEELAREGDANSIVFKASFLMNVNLSCIILVLRFLVYKVDVVMSHSDAEIPISSASGEDRRARADIAASFQVVSGGVASNQFVRARLNHIVEKKCLQLVCPPPSLCTDNGVMIALTGIEHFLMGRYDTPPPACEPEDVMLDLRPRWPLGEEYAEGRSEARSLKTARIHPSLTSLIQASKQQQS
ncbi:hypothetical protein DH2020_023268 [Rehmannia glutinosa]|uniref:Glycoprotease 1 n=1 Tax=Rehmannia glutinosa TaxID=99300 RepID=A0ABR0W9X5_REHGL